MRRHKGYRITARGRDMLAPERAGELFRELFLAQVCAPVYVEFEGKAWGRLRLAIPYALWQLRQAPH